jgi:pyruvate formate lyase activating enzyme
VNTWQDNPLTGIVFDIQRFSTRDGPGIRTTVFLKGCPLSCWWCHNPESQKRQPELFYRANLCIACQACLEACPQGAISLTPQGVLTDPDKCTLCETCLEYCYSDARQVVGKVMNVAQVMGEIRKDLPFYEQSGGGVTFSGGEPLNQSGFLARLLQECKQDGLHTVVDTSGFAPWSVIDGLRALVDLFLYDIKLIDEAAHLSYTGVLNQLILDNLHRLCASGQAVRVRVPIIPGINDSPAELRRLREFIAALPNEPEVELLPYHTSGVEKYRRLGREYALEGLAAMQSEELEKVTKLWSNYL